MSEDSKEEAVEGGKPVIEVEDEKSAGNLKLNGRGRTGSDPDAQEMVISSLRSQIQDLFSQVTQLNGKLVQSYDRVSDLEDELHVASSNLRSSSLKISQLELERTQHLSALNTGLLVEKSHVTTELTRLMEKATEEAAQRGQAESARADIEKDLDDLSASLFGQANSMVAEARYAQHLSDRKVEEAERALKGAEEAVGIMQQQMQAMQADKEQAEKEAQKMQVVMGKGKWTERQDSDDDITRSIRLFSTHVPYQEFLMFVAHLRSIHPSAPHPPAMTTLLPLPFLARLLNEDSEPTVRLDLAPSLNWLSRRSVLSAIHNGQLTIEPVTSTTLLLESASTNIPGLNSSSNNISCALCGTPIFSAPDANSRPHPQGMMHANSNSVSWSTSLFKKTSQSTNYPVSTNSSQPSSPGSINQTNSLHPPQVYIFRLTTTGVTSKHSIPSLPKVPAFGASTSTISQYAENTSSPLHGSPNPQPTTIYPLCPNTWCLARLRTTCSLWAFVRTGIVERIWEEEVPTVPPPSIATPSNGEKPPIPPRRRGLWGMASALGERAASWSEGDKDKSKKIPPATSTSTSASLTPEPVKHKDTKENDSKKLPPPPPQHPTVDAAHAPVRHSVPPPPLPRRSEVRRQPSPTKPAADSELVGGTDIPPSTEKEALVSPKSPTTTQPPPPPRSPHRSSTPSSVPLPESRPQTPVSVPGGPIPPPLPRRAAARATRPGGSRPTTPAPITGATETPSPTKATSPESTMKRTEETINVETTQAALTEDKRSSTTNVVLDPVAPAEPSAITPDGEILGQPSTTTNVADVPLSAPTPRASVEVKVEKKDGQALETKDGEPVQSEINKVPNEDTPSVNVAPLANGIQTDDSGANPGAEDREAKSHEEASENDAKQELVTSPQHVEGDKSMREKVDEAKEPTSDEDKDLYIGDTTWEERTWKELIRLREEMFWARVGALRS